MPKMPRDTSHRGIPFELMAARCKRRDQRPVLRTSRHDRRRERTTQLHHGRQFPCSGNDIQIQARTQHQRRMALNATGRATNWPGVDADRLVDSVPTGAV